MILSGSESFDSQQQTELLAQAHAVVVDDAAWAFIVHEGLCTSVRLRRAMVNPERAPLSGVVEAETIIPFRTKNDPVVVPAGRSGVGKMLVAGAVEIDGGAPGSRRSRALASRNFRLSCSAPSPRKPSWSQTTGPPTRIFLVFGTTRSPSARWRRTSRCPGSSGCFQISSVGASCQPTGRTRRTRA
jgi:hypothetical protein